MVVHFFEGVVFTDIGQVREALQMAVKFYTHERPHLSLKMRPSVEAAYETGRFRRHWISYRGQPIDAMTAGNTQDMG